MKQTFQRKDAEVQRRQAAGDVLSSRGLKAALLLTLRLCFFAPLR